MTEKTEKTDKARQLDAMLKEAVRSSNFGVTEKPNTKNIIKRDFIDALHLSSNYMYLDIRNYNSIYNALSYLLKNHNGFICGGCFKNILAGEEFKDVDIFFRNKEDFQEADDYYMTSDEWEFRYSNEKAVSYKETETGICVDLVRSIYGEPCEILDNFDFTITKIALVDVYIDYYEYNMLGLVVHNNFFEHLYNKRLVIDNKIPFPESTFSRTLRYTRYGYDLCAESTLKLLKAIKDSKNTIGINDNPPDGLYNNGGWD
ncbi:MAG: hypothetical protein ACRDD8_08230 [Bacteroidales bacterium]